MSDADEQQIEPSLTPEAELTPRPFRLGVTGLLFGIMALALATIPALALDRPLPNPFAPQAHQAPLPPPPDEPKGGLTLKYKSFSVNLGGRKEDPQPEPAKPKPEVTADPVRLFTIAAIVCSLIGIVISAIGQLKEHHASLTVSAISCCVAALTWQYFAAGILIGAGVAMFIIVIAMLGSMAS